MTQTAMFHALTSDPSSLAPALSATRRVTPVFRGRRATRSTFAGTALAGIAALVVALPACSAPEEQELFAETRDTLAMNVGDTCDLYEAYESLDPPSLNETWIHDQHTACGTGVCIWYGPGETVEPESTNVGTCSCRCDGPEDQGPFCTCPGGFRCEVDMIGDLGDYGNQENIDKFAGGYCMPE